MLLFGKEYFYYLLFCLHFLLCSNTRTRYLSSLSINSPLLPTSTRFAVPVTTSSANSAASRSLTSTAAATLVHSFVASRLDYCSSLYIGLPATCLNCLNRVLCSAARLIGRVSKFDHISAYMRDVLHRS